MLERRSSDARDAAWSEIKKHVSEEKERATKIPECYAKQLVRHICELERSYKMSLEPHSKD